MALLDNEEYEVQVGFQNGDTKFRYASLICGLAFWEDALLILGSFLWSGLVHSS